jgi:hypothetical protein
MQAWFKKYGGTELDGLALIGAARQAPDSKSRKQPHAKKATPCKARKN